MNARPSSLLPGTVNDPVLMELVEEVAARLQGGEAVDVEVCCQEHPEQADGLRRLWPAIRMMADLGRSADSALSGLEAEELEGAQGCLGDYRIIREVGRGGMGVVYE